MKTPVLEQLLEPVSRSLNAEAAEKLVQLRADAKAQRGELFHGVTDGRKDSAVFMRHLLSAGRWLKVSGHELAEGRQGPLPVLLGQCLPEVVQI